MVQKRHIDLAIIGAGPAGLAAAVEAKRLGLQDLVVLDRDEKPGGILRQCIHAGFGLEKFQEELTGPEYAHRYLKMAESEGVDFALNTTVLEMDKDRILTLVSEQAGLRQYECGSIILAMGCRERPRGAVGIPGSRPAGIFTAGHAQRLINIEGYMPGRTVVVLGSGDIGLIMARRLTLEGAQVEAVAEILPYPSGLVRNVVQCLHDFDIPLLLSHTVAEVHGDRRVEGVTLVQVDDRWTPVPGTERRIDCDTLLLSVGLIPENELSKAAGVAMDSRTGGAYVNDYFETSLQGVFSCGNVLHVNDVVDNVSSEGESAAHGAYLRVKGRMPERTSMVTLQADESIAQIVPHRVGGANDTTLHIRVMKPMGKMTLRVGDGFEKKYPFARPGEMIWVTVPKEIFRDASGPVTVRCEGR